MKLWVPSIGSMYQRVARVAGLRRRTPRRRARGPGTPRGSASRIARSIAWSACGHERPIRLGRDLEVAPEGRSGDRVGLVAGRVGEGEPGLELRLGRGGAGSRSTRRRSGRSGRAGRVTGDRSRPDPLVRRVPERLADDLEADPLAEDVDLAAGPDRRVGRQVGVGDRALDGEAVAAATSPGRRSRRRSGPARCRGRPSAGRRGRGSAGACAARPPCAATSASRPMKSASLSRATANPRPASNGVSSGVMSLDQTR